MLGNSHESMENQQSLKSKAKQSTSLEEDWASYVGIVAGDGFIKGLALQNAVW